MNRVDILGVEIDAVTAPELLAEVRECLSRGRRGWIATVNNEIAVRAQDDPSFRETLAAATWRIPDAAGIVWAADYLARRPVRSTAGAYLQALAGLFRLAVVPSRVRTALPGTIPGSDFTIELAGLCEEFGYRLFLLGAGPGVAEAAGRALKRQFPRLEIAGTSEGGHGAPAEDAAIRKRIADARAQVVLVAYGAPKQERWMARNVPKLPKPVMAIGIGGTLDYLAGASSVEGGGPAKQPPAWVRHRGFEWLWRLATQPSRWRRIITALPVFVRRVVRQKRTR